MPDIAFVDMEPLQPSQLPSARSSENDQHEENASVCVTTSSPSHNQQKSGELKKGKFL